MPSFSGQLKVLNSTKLGVTLFELVRSALSTFAQLGQRSVKARGVDRRLALDL